MLLPCGAPALSAAVVRAACRPCRRPLPPSSRTAYPLPAARPSMLALPAEAARTERPPVPAGRPCGSAPAGGRAKRFPRRPSLCRRPRVLLLRRPLRPDCTSFAGRRLPRLAPPLASVCAQKSGLLRIPSGGNAGTGGARNLVSDAPPHGTALSAAKPFRHGRGLTPSGRSCRLPASPLPPYPMRARSRSPDKPVSLRALQAPALCRRPPHGASRMAGTQGRGCAGSGSGRRCMGGRTGRRFYTSRHAALRSGLRQSPCGRELPEPGNIRPEACRPAKGLTRRFCAAPDCPQPRADTCHSPAAMRPLNPSGGSFLSRRNVNPSR